uniref:G-protein coupled receptors family 1 profile domain-containing protein n=1 Tax=Chaetoceros debilis TaxID=122233 RepID=A0A7S3VEY2_9STRA
MSQQDDPNDYWPKAYLAIVSRLNTSLSILASATIIFLIYRSQAKLSIIYHRIVLCMSIADILASLAMGLTTLPMPKEMPFEVELGYDWPGPRYGNTWTCNAQGFIWVFAGTIGFGLNAMLCLCKYIGKRTLL